MGSILHSSHKGGTLSFSNTGPIENGPSYVFSFQGPLSHQGVSKAHHHTQLGMKEEAETSEGEYPRRSGALVDFSNLGREGGFAGMLVRRIECLTHPHSPHMRDETLLS